MDAGLFEVLHHSPDVQLVAVVEGIDIEFHGVVEEAVDEQGLALFDDDLAGRAHEVVAQALGVVDDLHTATAEHEARAHQHRVADLFGDRDRARLVDGRAVPGRDEARAVEQLREELALFGDVDRGG